MNKHSNTHLKEERFHGWVDEGVPEQTKAAESKSQHNHIVVPEKLFCGVSPKISKWKYEVIPKSVDDEGAADGKRHPGDGPDGQRETHRQLGRAEILEEPEEVGLEEAKKEAADEEDDKEHEDVGL